MSQAIIEERNHTHGYYEDNARVTQIFKKIIRSENARRGQENSLSPVELDALEMIGMKMSRILTGARKGEHWEDIGGYSKLAENFVEFGHTLGDGHLAGELDRDPADTQKPITADPSILELTREIK